MSEDAQQGDELESRLREEAEAFRMQPSQAVWDRIDQQLRPVQHSRPSGWWWAAALLLLMAAWGGYQLMKQTPPSSPSGVAGNNGTNRKDSLLSRKSPIIPGQSNASDSSQSQAPDHTAVPAISIHNDTVNSSRQAVMPALLPVPEDITGANVSLPDNESYRLPAVAVALIRTGYFAGNDTGVSLPVQQVITLPAGLPDTAVGKQPGPGTARQHSRPSFEIVAIPAVSFRNMYQHNDMHDLASRDDYIHSDELHHTPEIAFVVGAHIRFPLSERLTLTSGLQLSKTGYNIAAIKTAGRYATTSSSLPGGSRNQMNGVTNNSQPVDQNLANANYGVYASRVAAYQPTTRIHTTYLMLEVPATLDYRIPLQHRWAVHIAAGAGLDYLVSQRAYIYAAAYKRYFTDNSLVRKWNANLLFSSYIAIPAGKVFLQAGPDFRYQLLNSYQHHYPVSEYPYAVGLHLGISWAP